MKQIKKTWMLPLAVGISVALTGCFDDDDDKTNVSSVMPLETDLLVARDLGNNTGVIERYTSFAGGDATLGAVTQSIASGLSEGIVKDAAGNLFQAGIANGMGTIATIGRFDALTSGAANPIDRTLSSALSGPKGIALAQSAGLVMVAENADSTNAMVVYSTTAADAAMPLYSLSRTSVGDTGSWDIAFDENSDRLFVALINGDIAFYDNYLASAASMMDPAPTAIFRPNNPLTTATNMHGIAYDAEADRLIVSDVADAAVADDGSIYVFNNASTLNGTVAADRTLRGASTLLGNPVDIQLRGNDLYVAEKANDGGRLLVFSDISSGDSGDIAPDYRFSIAAPESIIASAPGDAVPVDISDLSGQTIGKVLVSSNPSNIGTSVTTLNTDLQSQGDIFTATQAGQFIESISYDANGDAVVSFDDAGTSGIGGLSFIARISDRGTASYSDTRDRQITGSNTTLVAPKGMDVVSSKGMVLVTDLNAAAPGAIKAFSLSANGDQAPMMTTELPSGTRAWDVDYDPEADRLYVAGTNGTVLVYDDYLTTAPTTPARIIDPDDQSGFVASNLHGIVHDAENDRLILSDVGDAAVADDGRIYVVENASTANGSTPLSLELAGNMTALGNPVDLAFDGSHLYVAEKSNNQVQRIDNIYSLSGALNQAPTLSEAFTAPESVALIPQ